MFVPIDIVYLCGNKEQYSEDINPYESGISAMVFGFIVRPVDVIPDNGAELHAHCYESLSEIVLVIY